MNVSKPVSSEASINASGVQQAAKKHIFVTRPGLRFKLLSLVTGISLISILVSTLLLLHLQRQQMIGNAQDSATLLGSTLESNLRHAMLNNNRVMIEDMVQAAATNGTTGTIRILDAGGAVGVSSKANEAGNRFERKDPTCQICHAGSAPARIKTILFTPSSGQQILLTVNLIENEAECQTCHGREKQILGLLIIETSMATLNSQLSSGFWQTVLVALGSFVVLIGLIVPALNRYVIYPVEALSRGVAAISAGNLDFPVRLDSQDELGALARSFSAMQQKLKSSYSRMEKKEREAMALYALGTKISASLDLDEVLNAVAEAAHELLRADAGLIGLVDEEGVEVVVQAAAGIRAGGLIGMRIPVAEDTSGRPLVEGRPIIVEAFDPDSPILHSRESAAGEQIASFLAVPLQRGEYFLGMVEVMARKRRRFQEQDAQLLMRLSTHVVVSIENAKLYRKLRYMAALDERNHLAREMHDHLAQALGYLNVRASMVEELFASGSFEQARESLAELKRVAKLVYTDVRESIFNLRTPVASHRSLIPTLQAYLDEYHTYYGLDTQLLIESNYKSDLSPEVASQILWIIQEALTNVRKHSGAGKARVRYRQEGDLIYISIEDDGRGMNPAEAAVPGQQHFGLQIMRERAESVGGILELDSQPGRGTRVQIRAPASL